MRRAGLLRALGWLMLICLLATQAGASTGKRSRSGNRTAQGRPAVRHEVPSEGIVARAVPLDGPFYVRFLGWTRWQRATAPVSLRAGEEVRVLGGARVELQVPARGSLRSDGETCFMVRASEVLMDRGFADVRAVDQEPLALVTPAGELRAKGVRYSVEVRPRSGNTLARVLSGVLHAEPSGAGSEALAGTGMEVLLCPGASPVVTRSSVSVAAELGRFSDTGPGPYAGDWTGPGAKKTRVRAGAKRPTNAEVGLTPAPKRAAAEPADDDEARKPETLQRTTRGLSLRDRMRGLRDPEERMRRYELELAQQASADREELERAMARNPGRASLLADDVLYRKMWLEERREKNLARGEMLSALYRRRQLFDENQSRDELLASRREEQLGRSLWFQTRQGVAEARAELAQLATSIDQFNAQIAALGPAPASSAQARGFAAQRDAAVARANRLKDRIEELIEIQ